VGEAPKASRPKGTKTLEEKAPLVKPRGGGPRLGENPDSGQRGIILLEYLCETVFPNFLNREMSSLSCKYNARRLKMPRL
jgi:hypothetical protein